MNRLLYSSLVIALLAVPSIAAPQVGRSRETIVRQGATVRVRFPDNFDSDRNKRGDRFQAILDEDLVSNGRVVARAGSTVHFQLADVTADRSTVTLTLTGIQVDSTVVPIETNNVTVSTAPNRNQRLSFRLVRSADFNAGEGSVGSARRGALGRRITDIAYELSTRSQELLDATRRGRDETRGRRREATPDLYSAVERFASDTRAFSEGQSFRGGAARQTARNLVSQAEEISRLMGDGGFRYRDEWRLVEDQVSQLGDSFGVRYTPSRQLARGERGRDWGYDRGAADRGTFRWRGRVDGSDYIELRRDQVTVRHVQAQPITEATYDLGNPLPRQPITVQLTRLRGRGKVVLTQQPSASNNYTAVVHIEDNDGGSDFYEFELSW